MGYFILQLNYMKVCAFVTECDIGKLLMSFCMIMLLVFWIEWASIFPDKCSSLFATSLHESGNPDWEAVRKWGQNWHTDTWYTKSWDWVDWAVWWRSCSTLEAQHDHCMQLNRELGLLHAAEQEKGLADLWERSLWESFGESYGGHVLHTLSMSACGPEENFAISLSLRHGSLIRPCPCQTIHVHSGLHSPYAF